MADQTITFNFAGSGSQLVSETKKIEQELNALDGAAKRNNQSFSEFQALGGAIAAGGLAVKIKEIGNEVLQTGLKFEGLQAQLESALGSKSGAQQAFSRLQSFAATTPNQLDETVRAFISLRQRGIDPTNDTLRKSGDIAASQNKSLQQFVEAVLDATTNENERLKEFGIIAAQAGDQVKFTFNGVAKTVDKTPEAISKALLSFGELEGVAGGMEKRAATLGGQFSNLTDNTEALQTELFSLAQGPAIAVVQQANNLINGFRELPAPIRLTVLATAGFGGALVAAIAAVTAFNLAQGAAIVSTARQSAALVTTTISTNAYATAQFLAAAATGKLTEAQAAQGLALAGTAAKMGLIAAAAGSILLVADTYLKTTEASRELQKETDNLAKSLDAITEIEAKRAKAAGDPNAGKSLEDAAIERAKKRVGGVQNALDAVREGFNTLSGPIDKALGLPPLATAAGESLREEAVAFEEQAKTASDLSGKVFSLFGKGAKALSDNDLKAYTSGINEAIETVKKKIPIDQQEADLKEQTLALLEKSKAKLDAETKARKDVAEASQNAAKAVKELNEAFKIFQAKAEIANLQDQLGLMDRVLAGRLSDRQLAAQNAALEERQNIRSIAALAEQREKLAAQRANSDKDGQKAIDEQSLSLEKQQAEKSLSIVKGRIAERKRLEGIALQDLETEQKKGADAIAALESQKQADIQQAINAGLITDEQAAVRKLKLTQGRIQGEIALEKDKAETLQNLTFSDPQEEEANQAKIRASRQRTAQLTLQALENQRATEGAIAKELQKAIADRADQEKNQSEARVQQITAQLKAQELLNNT